MLRRTGRLGAVVAAAVLGALLAACTAQDTVTAQDTATAHDAVTAPASPAERSSTSATTPGAPASSPSHRPRSTARSRPTRTAHAVPFRSRLPLHYRTGTARQVITVVAPGHTSTTARLQAWRRGARRWVPVGGAIHAWLGADGFSRPASEQSTATPAGSFTLTHAFGHDSDPGTALPYLHTTPADWWISQPGPLYNTHQRCSAHCRFTQGDPNEHLFYETPYYDYAVVIDYNTRNAPGGVRQGRGSAFFLHVTVGAPTQGCVSIPQPALVRILRWLRPADHPRILLGVD